MTKENEFILVIQHIKIYWHKKHRGAPYASLRERYVKEFVLPKEYFHYNRNYGLPIHEVIIEQTDKGLEIRRNEMKISKYEDLVRLGGVEILFDKQPIEVVYRYSTDACGAPRRYDRRYNLLCEKAFDLNKGESGTVIHNGRYSAISTGDEWLGEWIYHKEITNICVTQDYKEDIFYNKPTDKCYEQIAILN